MNSIWGLGLLSSAACLSLLVSAEVCGQSNTSLSGPILGYVFSAPEGKLRPLRGVLGSATVGDPMEFDFGISQALTLDERHVVASTTAHSELLAIGLDTHPPSLAVISGAPSTPTQAAASVHGTAAAFYYAGIQHLLIVTGLPGRPVVSQSIDLAYLRGQPLTHTAVNDDGTLLIYSASEGDRESVYTWTPSSTSSRFVFSVFAVGGIAITGNGAAIVTDRYANEVFAVWDARNAAIPRHLLGERDGILGPGAVAISTDNQVYIANTGSATIIALDSSGRLLRTQRCNCDLSGLDLLRDSVFRLTEGLDRTIYLLETSSRRDHIVFIPPRR